MKSEHQNTSLMMFWLGLSLTPVTVVVTVTGITSMPVLLNEVLRML